MSEPIRIRARIRDDGFTEVRVLIAHVMESGRRIDASGARVPANIITEVRVWHGERMVLHAALGTAMAANPWLAFHFAGGRIGDTVAVDWADDRGARRRDEVRIA